jgi:leucyl aminopeptidase (aminopeptidase T)
MTEEKTMIEAALAAMTHVLDLAPADRVLVLTDQDTLSCGQAFECAAVEHGCDVVSFVLPREKRPLTDLPDGLLPLLEDRTVVINAIVGDHREIPFRLRWIEAIENTGRVRMGHSPGITRDMMTAGPLNVDYGLMAERANRLAELLSDAVSVRVTTALGTDLVMDLTDRRFVTDLKATVKEGANLPCGEIYCCPVETGAHGVLVVDGCYGSAGTVPAPVTMVVQEGKVVDVSCDHEPTAADVQSLLDTDATSCIIAELGIGLNQGARLTDKMLEAEKAHGTAHIAFGSNKGMPGGRNDSATHIDYLFTRPTITAETADGTVRQVLDEGRIAG